MRNKIVLGLVSLFAFGCQTVPYQGQARNVKVKPRKEGVVSIPVQHRVEDRSKAEEVMARNCSPLEPTVMEEMEVAVGTKTDKEGTHTDRKSSEREIGSLFGLPVTTGEAGGKDVSTSSTTTQIKEWHISYKCTNEKTTSVQ